MNIGTKYSVGSHSQIYFQWEEQSQDLAKGVTVVKWQLVLKADAYGAIDSSKKKSYSVKVDGQTYQGTNTIGISNNQSKILAQGTTSMVHDANGNKTFNYSFKQEFGFYSQSLKKQIDFVEGSGSGTLSQIKLYPVITSAPNFAFGDKPTITFDLKGYDYTKVAVCISLTKAKSDISYRYIPPNTNQYTFNLTEDDYQILNQKLTSRSRTVYFFIRTTIGKDSEGNDIYTRSYVPVTYTCKGAISIINDKKLWVDCTSFRRKNSAGIHKFLPDDSVSLCVDSMDFLYIAFDYEKNLNFYGRTVGTKIDIEFHGKKLRYTLGDNCSSVPSDIDDYTQTILQPWDSEMFANKSSITDYLRITFYNDFGDKVVTQRLIRVIKYNPPTFKATVSRLTDTTAQILFNVECSQIQYSTSVNGTKLTNAIQGINIKSATTDSNTVNVNNIVDTPIIKDNLITIKIKNITSDSYIINGEIIDGIGEEAYFTIIIPPIQRPLNINTQAVAVGEMINNTENDGRFKCGWDAYFNNAHVRIIDDKGDVANPKMLDIRKYKHANLTNMEYKEVRNQSFINQSGDVVLRRNVSSNGKDFTTKGEIKLTDDGLEVDNITINNTITHQYPKLLYTYENASYFKSVHSFILSGNSVLQNQPTGYLIEWCYIEAKQVNGKTEYEKYTTAGLNYSFIPKCIPSDDNISLSFPVYDYLQTPGVKGVIINNNTTKTTTTIKGVDENGNSPNNRWAIHRVFGI